MSPLIAIAVNLLPDLAKRLTKGSQPETQGLVEAILQEVLGTDDPIVAERRSKDAQVAGKLRIRLAEVENLAARQDHDAEQNARQMQLDTLRTQMEGDASKRDADMKILQTRLKDQQNARGTFLDLSKGDSPFAWGPVVVSVVVTVGFFATLITLITLIRGGLGTSANPADQMVLQIVNIAVGALTAGFATVVSFWLGSSDGSRRKDINAIQVQSNAAQLQREIVSEQSRHTAAMLASVTHQTKAAAPVNIQRPKDPGQFARCLEIILGHEGGFADHPRDPGGATNMGMTQKTLEAWRGVPVTKEDIRNLTAQEASEIYRASYWNALNCDNLPAGVDLIAFDFGVNAGVSRSAKILQKVVFVEQDGQIGQITLGAARTLDPGEIISAMSDARMDYYRGLPDWKTFKTGWTRRTGESRAAALGMI